MKPLKPVDQYTPIAILKEVKERFGSINNFNKLSGRQPTDLYYLKDYDFKRRATVRKVIESICEDIKKHQPKELYLQDYDRIQIRDTIREKYDTLKAFIDHNPDFSYFWLSRVVNGSVSKITGKIKRLMETLEIEL